MGRKAPRKRLARRVISAFTRVFDARWRAPRVPRTHPNVSRRSAHPSFRVSEATMQTPGAKNAPRERRGVVRCQIFQLVVPAEPRQRREPESIITGGGYGFRVREHAAKLAQAA